MGKTLEKGTPKELANRTKSKGLQKLRWYCEMCKKQCRDQNGFKCHLTSESHQRQLLLFAENQGKYLSEFSREFESNFLQLLRTSFGSKRVRANEVYQEYIKDKGHVHMNATRWHSLTGFIQYLGESGKCRVDQTEKGWHIAYIDKEEELRFDSLSLVRTNEFSRAQIVEKARAEKDDEQRKMEMIAAQIERDRALHGDEVAEHVPTELVRSDDGEKIVFSLSAPKKPTEEELKKPLVEAPAAIFAGREVKKEVKSEPDDHHKRHSHERKEERSNKRRYEEPHTSSSRSLRKDDPRSKKSALEEIKEMEERKRAIFEERELRREDWLHEGIIVKILTKKLGEKLYKAKGEVVEVRDNGFVGIVELADGTQVKLDQEHLETVIPAVGKRVKVVNGALRGQVAEVLDIEEKKFAVRVKVVEGRDKGRSLSLPYEDVSKCL